MKYISFNKPGIANGLTNVGLMKKSMNDFPILMRKGTPEQGGFSLLKLSDQVPFWFAINQDYKCIYCTDYLQSIYRHH